MMISPRKLAKKALGIQTWNSDDDQKLVIPDAKIIFDVGANIGQTARSYRRLFPQAEIWSFEPFPASFDALFHSVSDQKFHPEPLALSDRIAGASLNIGAVSITNSLLRRETDSGKTIEIKTDTLDHFCSERGITNIDILKVDVEGAEDRVFRGASGLFSRRAIRSVFVEVYFNPVYEGMPLFWDLQAQLSDLGFSLFGLYSMIPTRNGALSFANALYVLQPVRHAISPMDHSNTPTASFAGPQGFADGGIS
jgi:FkbM family methyltransferase